MLEEGSSMVAVVEHNVQYVVMVDGRSFEGKKFVSDRDVHGL